MTRLSVAFVAVLLGCPQRSTPDAGPIEPPPWTWDGGPAEISVIVTSAPAPAPGKLLANGQAFSGTAWFPFGASSIVGPTVASPPHRLGALRYALESVLAAPGLTRDQYVAALPAALPALPDLDFLARWQSSGGELIINVMATPEWLTSAPVPNALCGSHTRWRPPADLVAWKRDVVTPIATFFTQRFGPGLRWEVWNEPTTCTFLGTTAQYNALYAATAEAVRAVDRTARLGGPSHADSVGTPGTQNDDDRSSPFVKRFIDAARTNGAPIDFVSLHSYQTNPNPNAHFHADQLRVVRAWLADAGFEASRVELINDEWNYEAYHPLVVPPGGSPNLNLAYLDAVYSAQTLLAFDEAGYDNQAGQAIQDTGGDVASQTFTAPHPMPRPGYQIFELASRLSGVPATTVVEHPWVRAVAFRDGKVVRVFAASVVPRPDWSIGVGARFLATTDPSIGLVLAADAQRGPVLGAWLGEEGTPLPAALSAAFSPVQQKTLDEARALVTEEALRRRDWGVDADPSKVLSNPGRPVTWEIVLPGVTAISSAKHAIIDSRHGVSDRSLPPVLARLKDAARQQACASAGRLDAGTCPALAGYCQTGDSSGLGKTSRACSSVEAFALEFTEELGVGKTLRSLKSSGFTDAELQRLVDEYRRSIESYRPRWEQELHSAELSLVETDVTTTVMAVDGGVRLVFGGEPWSVQFITFTVP